MHDPLTTKAGSFFRTRKRRCGLRRAPRDSVSAPAKASQAAARLSPRYRRNSHAAQRTGWRGRTRDKPVQHRASNRRRQSVVHASALGGSPRPPLTNPCSRRARTRGRDVRAAHQPVAQAKQFVADQLKLLHREAIADRRNMLLDPLAENSREAHQPFG